MRTRLLAFFAVTSLVAVASGCYVASHAGVAASLWLRNLAAWAVGALLAWGISRISPEILLRVAMVLAPLALLASLLGAGQEGVHRWIPLRGFQVHAAFLMLPFATVAFVGGAQRRNRWALSAILGTGAVLCLQPDASQATAFAAAMVVVVGRTPHPGRSGVVAALWVGMMAALSWLRPDPLTQVPEVEGILGLAKGISPVLAGICGVSMLASAIVPLVACRKASPHAGKAARALSAYFLVCAAMPFVGAFPVPLVGMGVSPILGFWLGVGALAAVCREEV
jgi:hypothetical protein